MSFMNYLTRSRSSLVARSRHCQPSIAYIYHANVDTKLNNSPPSLPGTKSFLPFPNSSKIGLFQYATKGSHFPVLPHFGASFYRHMSTANDDNLLGETVVQAVASSPTPEIGSEVAFAAAGSALPVATLQYLIDAVHSFTGFNWWASIVLTTLIMRGALLTFEIMLRKIPKPKEMHKLVQIAVNACLQNKATMDPEILQEVEKYIKGIPAMILTVLPSIFPIVFFLAISNMAEKVPSFKTGGLYWFLDLSTQDSSLIFPLLTALTIWSCRRSVYKSKRIPVVLAVISVPLTSFFPQAMFFYWIPSILFSATMSKVCNLPAVRLFLGFSQRPDSEKRSGGAT